MKTKILAFAVLILGTAFSRAQDSVVPANPTTISLSLYFQQGYSRLDTAFRGNGGRMENFARDISEKVKDPGKDLRNIIISTGASPEGSSVINKALSDKRAAAVSSYILTILPYSREKTYVISKGIDWEGLRTAVSLSDMPDREAVLDIIDRTPVWVIKDETVVDSRKRRLMMLDGGRTWHYMEEHFFPDLRGGTVNVICEFANVANSIKADIVPDDIADKLVSEECVSVKEIAAIPDTIPELPDIIPDTATTDAVVVGKPGFNLGIGTNLIYDALLIPNISLEFPFAARWSAGVNWMYGWKERDARRFVHAYGGELHLRYWLGQHGRPLSGHHFGAYGQMLRYNIRHSGRGYLSDRWSYGAGIEYGYSLPLGRRFRIDMAVGAGYLTGICREYVRQDECDVWQATKRRHWFGPTKAEISVIWVIGRVNSTKGGVR